MSLCETVRKLALKGILLTSTLGMMSCSTEREYNYVTTPELHRIDIATKALCRNDVDTALWSIKIDDANNPSFDCLRAVTLLVKWDNNKANLFALNDANDAFNKAINDFVDSPGIIELIQDDLGTYFSTDHDEKLEKEVKKYIPLAPGLTGAIAYLRLAKQDYKGTKVWLEKYLKTNHPSEGRKAALRDALKVLINKNEEAYTTHLKASVMPQTEENERAYHLRQLPIIEKRLAGYRLIQPIFPEDKKFSAEATLNVK